MREDLTPQPASAGVRGWRQRERGGAATVDARGMLGGERGTPGAHEALAAYVRWLMAECRARLAAEDAGQGAARDQQDAEGNAG